MDKVICDICGTIYPESEEKCPTCGCSRDFGLDNMEEEFLAEGILDDVTERPMPRKKSKVFDYDEVNEVRRTKTPQVEDDFDDEEDEEEEPRTNVGLVVILLILIVLLLLTAGFFFVRYFLPHMKPAEETKPVVTTAPVETEAVSNEVTELTIPCINLSVPGGKIELGEGGKWLMNVQVFPKDTTDTLAYASTDESVVTVSEDGTVSAVGEGSAQIIVTCGSKQISTNVVVDYSAGVETIATETIPAMELENADSTEASEIADATGASQETEPAEETQPQETTDAADATESGELVVKLKKTDISIFARYTSVTLELDCDLELSDLTWFTMDSTVAIVNDGVVTATGSGITRIYGDYGDQRVECIIRCSF